MPRAMFRIQGGVENAPVRETSFVTPKKVGNIDSWWKALRKIWPDLPDEYYSVWITTDKITFAFPFNVGKTQYGAKVYIDRTYKFGSQ